MYKRNYKKENNKTNELCKRMTVKVPKELAKQLEYKLHKEQITYSSIALEAIKNYINIL